MFNSIIKLSVLFLLSLSFSLSAGQMNGVKKHLIRSVKFANQEMYSEAMQEANKALAIDPENPDAQAVQAKIQLLMSEQGSKGKKTEKIADNRLPVKTKNGSIVRTKNGQPVTTKKKGVK